MKERLRGSLAASARSERYLRYGLAAVGLLLLLVALLVRGPDLTDKIASIVAAVLGLLAEIRAALGTSGPPITAEACAGQVRSEVGQAWKDEADVRGLLADGLLPMTAEPVAEHGEHVWSVPNVGPPTALWTSAQLASHWVACLDRPDRRRMIVYGKPGSGKTSLALLLALGLVGYGRPPQTPANGGADSRLVPLLVPLASWEGQDWTAEEFARWLNRELASLYPSTRRISARGWRSRGGALLDSGRFVLMLDGFDEVPAAVRSRAATAISRFVHSDNALVIFTRQQGDHEEEDDATVQRTDTITSAGGDIVAALSAIPNTRAYAIDKPTAALAALYLAVTTVRRSEEASQDIRRIIAGLIDASVLSVLANPLMLSLVRRNVTAGTTDLTTLLALASAGKGGSVWRQQIEGHVQSAIGPDSPGRLLRHDQALSWVGYLANELVTSNRRTLSWWRLPSLVPSAVFAFVASLVTGPAYLFALSMPVGLTRGLVIGCAVGIAMGFLRGRPAGGRGALFALATSLVLVLSIGSALAGWKQGLADAVEISSSVGCAYAFLEVLLAGKRLRALLLTCTTACVATAATMLVRVVAGHHDPDRGPVSLFVGVSLGVGIATVAARMFIDADRQFHHSTIRFGPGRRQQHLLDAVSHAVVSASIIGLGGALGGGMRKGLDYGIAIFVVFSLVIGLPVGIAGGLIKWLNSPFERYNKPLVPSGSLSRDRTVALTSIVVITAAAVAGSYLLLGPLRAVSESISAKSPNFVVGPANGLIIGWTLGLIVACSLTAWPALVVARIWFASQGRLPWRLMLFAHELYDAGILRREGSRYRFRYAGLRQHFAESERSRTVLERQPNAVRVSEGGS